jgi:hypothetical protein
MRKFLGLAWVVVCFSQAAWAGKSSVILITGEVVSLTPTQIQIKDPTGKRWKFRRSLLRRGVELQGGETVSVQLYPADLAAPVK